MLGQSLCRLMVAAVEERHASGCEEVGVCGASAAGDINGPRRPAWYTE
jgi:hypothetical protein